jgi:ElaB/YqjD/DUF883 family membrane-anchored ribosome-binding protein
MTSMDNASRDIGAEFSDLREEVARLTTKIAELLQLQTKAAGLGISDAIETAQEKIAGAAGDAKHRVRAAGSEIETRIERNPLTALLVVFGIGMSVGLISRSRH